MRSIVKLCLVLALCTVSVVVPRAQQAGALSQVQGQINSKYRIKALVDNSQQILVGTVQTCTPVQVLLSSQNRSPIFMATLGLNNNLILKGKPQGVLPRRMTLFFELPVVAHVPIVGQTALLFIGTFGAGSGSTTLAQDISDYNNGWFNVDWHGHTYDSTAVNLAYNTALWNSAGNLWSMVNKDTVQKKLRANLDREGLKGPALEDRIQKVLARGSEADPRGPLPLDLLVAVIEAIVQGPAR